MTTDSNPIVQFKKSPTNNPDNDTYLIGHEDKLMELSEDELRALVRQAEERIKEAQKGRWLVDQTYHVIYREGTNVSVFVWEGDRQTKTEEEADRARNSILLRVAHALNLAEFAVSKGETKR